MFPPSLRRKSRDRSCANFKNFLYSLERTFWQTQKHKQNADLSNHDWLSWFAANTSRAKFRSTCVSSATHTFEYVKVQAVCRYARAHRLITSKPSASKCTHYRSHLRQNFRPDALPMHPRTSAQRTWELSRPRITNESMNRATSLALGNVSVMWRYVWGISVMTKTPGVTVARAWKNRSAQWQSHETDAILTLRERGAGTRSGWWSV